MAYWQMYVFSPWVKAPLMQGYDDLGNLLPPIDPKRRYPQLFMDYPTMVLGSDDSGQPQNHIPPIPNLMLCYVECRGTIRQAIVADTNYAVLAQRQINDQWRYCAAGEHYLGYDDTDTISLECPTHAGSVLAIVGLDAVPWRIPRAMRQTLRTWLMAKGVSGAKAREILQDTLADDLDMKDIRRLTKAYIESLPAGP